MTFSVAVIGRPNVGKSTLFNRLTGKRHAIVDDTPGVTRDRREGEGRLAELEFTLIDTAGLEDSYDDSLEGRMRRQTEIALDEADVTLFMIDGRAGLTPLDEHFAGWLRERNAPVLLVVNKCEGKAGLAGLLDSYSLGLGEPIAISSEHGEGLGELYDALKPFSDTAEEQRKQLDELTGGEKYDLEQFDDSLEDDDEDEGEDEIDPDRPLKLAIVGRPNVGKSTLVNQLVGSDRMLTGPEAGITRDAIAVRWQYEGRPVRLVDTAGLRRKSKVRKKLENLSVGDTLRTVRYAEIVILVLDANMPFDKQDLTIARMVAEQGRGLIIVINKWDAVEDRKAALQHVEDKLLTSLTQVKGVPVITCSAKSGKGLNKLLPAVVKLYDTWNKRISTGALNRWLDDMVTAHPPPLASGRRIKLRYMTQAKSRPPTFILFSSRADQLQESYLRYLVNGLREDFNLPGTPIRMLTRKGENPYVDSK